MSDELTKPLIKVHTTKYREINIPERMNNELAELVGIHFGDGGIHVRKRKTYNVTCSFNVNEVELIEEYKRLMKNLFGLEPKSYLRSNCVEFYCCSKLLAYFLNQNFNAPLGRKENLMIPPIIKLNTEYLQYFLRGLFKTDGCLIKNNSHGKEYPIIKITNKSKEFIEEITSSLIDMGFKAKARSKCNKKYNGYDTILCGFNQLYKWKQEILKEDGAAGTFNAPTKR